MVIFLCKNKDRKEKRNIAFSLFKVNFTCLAFLAAHFLLLFCFGCTGFKNSGVCMS
jgi:hypothetical protein